MKNWLNKYFGFTKREYNGLLFLMAILLSIALFPPIYELFASNSSELNTDERQAIQKLQLVSAKEPNRYAANKHMAYDEDAPQATLFEFDPNQIDVGEWQQLGLSAKQAQAIINYRNKGGKFYKVEDLQKMYTISPALYEKLKPYVMIAEKPATYLESKRPFDKNTASVKVLPVIEINSADTLQLDEIKGIGQAFARRIVKYRDRLGGFYQKEQLMEVYGLDSAKFEEIKAQVRVDAGQIKKININTATFEELKNHPYLKYKQINTLIQYRKQHGAYKDVEDLKKVAILTPQNIQNLVPYLTF